MVGAAAASVPRMERQVQSSQSADAPNTGMMVMVHRAFERDLNRLRGALANDPRNAQQVAAITAYWELFFALLEHHHQAEDQALWPTLVQAYPGSAEVVAEMEAEHAALDAALVAAQGAVALWSGAPDAQSAAAASDALGEVEQLLVGHLQHEELTALPLVDEHMTSADWGVFTARNGQLNADVVWAMPWLADGQPAPVRAAIWSFVPEPARSGAAVQWRESYEAVVVAAFGGAALVTGPE